MLMDDRLVKWFATLSNNLAGIPIWPTSRVNWQRSSLNPGGTLVQITKPYQSHHSHLATDQDWSGRLQPEEARPVTGETAFGQPACSVIVVVLIALDMVSGHGQSFRVGGRWVVSFDKMENPVDVEVGRGGWKISVPHSSPWGPPDSRYFLLPPLLNQTMKNTKYPVQLLLERSKKIYPLWGSQRAGLRNTETNQNWIRGIL